MLLLLRYSKVVVSCSIMHQLLIQIVQIRVQFYCVMLSLDICIIKTVHKLHAVNVATSQNKSIIRMCDTSI